LYWLTQGKPNQWPLILWAHGEKELYQWDMPLTTFFAKTFSNKTKCQLWDEPFKKKELLFQPEN
jgi:hypothetical protein